MLYHRSHPHHKKRNFSEVGHYAVGTANLIPTTTLNTRFHSDEWSSASQKPLLYGYAKGGEVVDHDMGDGHRRTLQQVDRLDYSTYVR